MRVRLSYAAGPPIFKSDCLSLCPFEVEPAYSLTQKLEKTNCCGAITNSSIAIHFLREYKKPIDLARASIFRQIHSHIFSWFRWGGYHSMGEKDHSTTSFHKLTKGVIISDFIDVLHPHKMGN